LGSPISDLWGKHDTLNIRTVIHLDIPYSAEDLDFAGTLGTPSARYETGDEDSALAEYAAPLAAERYAQMLCYARDVSRCRREQLLGFLGQELASCSGCDVCDGRVLAYAEGEAQILEFVLRNRQRFTLRQIGQLLRGAKSYEVVRGGLAAYQEEEIEEALETLRRAGNIKVMKRGFWRERIASGRIVGPRNPPWNQ